MNLHPKENCKQIELALNDETVYRCGLGTWENSKHVNLLHEETTNKCKRIQENDKGENLSNEGIEKVWTCIQVSSKDIFNMTTIIPINFSARH